MGWLETSPYRLGKHQWLEHRLGAAETALDELEIGGVGAADFGRSAVDRLMADGVDCRLVRSFERRATAVAFVSYLEDGSRQFIYHIDGTPAVWADSSGAAQIEDAAFFHVMGCLRMANDDFRGRISAVAETLAAHGARISFAPNIRPELLGQRRLDEVVGPILRRAHVLLPGTAELAMLGGQETSEANVEALLAATPLEIVVVKQGKQGCTVYMRAGAEAVPAYPVNEVNLTGAGDCFDAGFLCGLLEGKSLRECALNAGAFGPMEEDISPATVARAMASGRV